MRPEDDDSTSWSDYEEIPAEDGSIPIDADPEFLATLEASRAWDIWFADMLRMRRRLLNTVILTFERHAAHPALTGHQATRWSGDFRGAIAQSNERAAGNAISTLEFANFALDVAIREGRLILTLFSSVFDVAGVSLSVRTADGRTLSRGETDMLGRLELAVPEDAAFDLIVEPPSRAAV